MPAGTLERPRSAPAPETRTQPQIDTIALPQRDILLLGAGSGWGRDLAVRLADRGYRIIAGTRNPDKFESLRAEIVQAGGPEPLPLIADILKADEFDTAFAALKLPPGTPLHYFPVAAGGLDYRPVQTAVGLNLIRLERQIQKTGAVTLEAVQEATDKIKTAVTQPEAMNAAMAINYSAPLRVLDMLRSNGHIDGGTTILNTSSSLSDDADSVMPIEQYIVQYKGGWFYFTIGRSKEAGVQAFARVARTLGIGHLNAVAGELPNTGVGGNIDRLENVLRHLEPPVEMVIPRIETGPAADQVIAELARPLSRDARIRKLYVDNQEPGYTRPKSWGNTSLPYF